LEKYKKIILTFFNQGNGTWIFFSNLGASSGVQQKNHWNMEWTHTGWMDEGERDAPDYAKPLGLKMLRTTNLQRILLVQLYIPHSVDHSPDF
jgi:hypothetical protein